MTITIETIQATLDNIERLLAGMPSAQRVSGQQVTVVEGLSDISESLGLIKAGEFRSGTGDPGFGFTGVRMGSPGWIYDTQRYAIVGVENDVMQFGLSQQDGNLYAGGGRVRVNQYGIQMDAASDEMEAGSIHYRYHDTLGVIHDIAEIYAEYDAIDDETTLAILANKDDTMPWSNSVITLRSSVIDGSNFSSSSLEVNGNGLLISTAVVWELQPHYRSNLSVNTDSIGGMFYTYQRNFMPDTYSDFYGYLMYSPEINREGASGAVSADSAITLWIDGAPILGTDVSATRKYAIKLTGGAWINEGSLDLGTGLGTGNGSMSYSGNLLAYRNAANYTGYIFVPLTTPLTSTSFDGDSFSTTAKTLIDLSAAFGAPDGIKAVLIKISTNDSASATTNCFFAVSPNNTANSLAFVSKPTGLPNDQLAHATGFCPCDANGDIYYQCTATGAGTLDVTIQIWGYFI